MQTEPSGNRAHLLAEWLRSQSENTGETITVLDEVSHRLSDQRRGAVDEINEAVVADASGQLRSFLIDHLAAVFKLSADDLINVSPTGKFLKNLCTLASIYPSPDDFGARLKELRFHGGARTWSLERRAALLNALIENQTNDSLLPDWEQIICHGETSDEVLFGRPEDGLDGWRLIPAPVPIMNAWIQFVTKIEDDPYRLQACLHTLSECQETFVHIDKYLLCATILRNCGDALVSDRVALRLPIPLYARLTDTSTYVVWKTYVPLFREVLRDADEVHSPSGLYSTFYIDNSAKMQAVRSLESWVSVLERKRSEWISSASDEQESLYGLLKDGLALLETFAAQRGNEYLRSLFRVLQSCFMGFKLPTAESKAAHMREIRPNDETLYKDMQFLGETINAFLED